MKSGRVIKILSDRFMVDTDNGTVFVKSRKKLKREILPIAGDFVTLEYADGEYVLSAIMPRKNRLIRPSVANADQIVITVAPVPEAEFLTIDKLIISAHKIGIRSVLCVNKSDISSADFVQDIISQYDGVVDEIVSATALCGDTAALRRLLENRFSCFAGQSAVGKTSLINEICGLDREVGNLSEKTSRGKNTTTGTELIKIGDNTFVADTPGFAALDLFDIAPSDLHLYYDEYVRVAPECKYRMCTHIAEPECAVRAAVECGKLSKLRYERYILLAQELKKQNRYEKNRRTQI